MIVATFGCSRPPDCTIRGGFARRFAVTKLLLPTERTLFAADLDGDQKLDNQLGLIVDVLTSSRATPPAPASPSAKRWADCPANSAAG